MKFRPLNDWALIQESYAPEKTAGGIIIPDAAREKPAEGIVIAIGPGRYKAPEAQAKGRGTKKGEKKKKEFVPTSVLPGQRVLYMKYLTNEIELDGVKYVLAREEHILGTFDEPVSPPASRGARDLMARPEEPGRGRKSPPTSSRGEGSAKRGPTGKATASSKALSAKTTAKKAPTRKTKKK
ncbi:MAG: hypothetical protein ACWGN7_01820 [Thermodesulfovibrionales bacterium]